MTTFSLNGEIEKTLGYAKKISRVADNWLTNGLLPNLEDLKELKSDIGEIERGLESTRDEIQKRERLGPASSWQSTNDDDNNLTTIKQKSLKKWSFIGKGAFSAVFLAKYKGANVATKILQPEKIGTEHEETFLKEMDLTSILRHGNVIAFRYEGTIEDQLNIDTWHLQQGQRFFVMEYVPSNLKKYVMSRSTHEGKGLPDSIAWNFAAQIVCGLAYLHDLKVAHRDIKPDNILIYPESRILKLGDFGEAYMKHRKEASNYLCPRYAAPEMWTYFDQNSLNADLDQDFTEMFLRADVYAYGNTVAFCVLGIRPWHTDRTEVINVTDWDPTRAKIELPKHRPDGDPLKALIMNCYENDPGKRPASAAVVLDTYFSDDANPYESKSVDTDFFTFGFLKDTKLYIADSLVEERDEEKSQKQQNKYSLESLMCRITLEKDESLPEQDHEWDYYQFYCEKRRGFNELTESGEIQKDTSVALKNLQIPLRTEGNNHFIRLEFTQTSYLHHRSLRAVWREKMTSDEKLSAVPCKRIVNNSFSTSFGLHLAVITTDRKVLFFQRENTGTNPSRGGLPGPHLFTCTVTKSLYKESYVEKDNETFVSLLHSAAFCLNEELGINLNEAEQEAIHFHTVYLKFDNHEWGMCAYIDLADARIAKPRRLTSNQIQTQYTTAKKTKHNRLFSVQFDPYAVAFFVGENLIEMASSTKMVVVKTLKAFFSRSTVEDAFKEK